MRGFTTIATLVLGCWEVSLAARVSQHSSARTVRVGFMEDTFHQAESAVLAHVLKRRCYDVEFQILSHTEAFKSLLDGSIDILPSVWLPSGHASFLVNATMGRDYEVIGTTSEEGVFYWVVSEALSTSVKSIDDLADPSKTEGMWPQIHGPMPDSGLSMESVKITAALNQRRAENNITSPRFEYVSDFGAMVDFLQDPHTEKYASAFWGPNWLVASYLAPGQVLRIADGTLADFGLPNRGVTLLNGEFRRSDVIDAETLAALGRVFVGNSAISAMDLEMKQLGVGPMEVAEKMMSQQEYKYWYEDQLPCKM